MFDLLKEHLEIIIPMVTAFFGGLGTFLVTKLNVNKDLTINDRVQLSKDKFQLIAEMRQMMQDQKKDMDFMKRQITTLQETNVTLLIKNDKLENTVAQLTKENKTLHQRVAELSQKLSNAQQNNNNI